ncbi:MAG: phosphoglucosamine mutase [Desulfobacteraceae bacterium]
MSKKLFGTDGIRGTANRYPMTCEVALKTGRAVARLVLEKGFDSAVIGKDTRKSCDMLEAALAAGITSEGVDVWSAGVIPTPAVARLAVLMENTGAGIMISASHNPYHDNGIKIFDGSGNKLSGHDQEAIESYIHKDEIFKGSDTGRVFVMDSAVDRYGEFLLENIDTDKIQKPFKLVVDCANGAACRTAKSVFIKPLFDARFIFDAPDGMNINENCGSQHTQTLSRKVTETGADMGLAFDGDADRLIAVDEKGGEITGDRILAVCAEYMKKKGTLNNNVVVSTVMSNIGLSKFLKSREISHEITGVGDIRVKQRMTETRASIGGEDSGHMIFSSCHTTGDGLLTALKLIEIVSDTRVPLSELAGRMKVYPQILMNVQVDSSRPDFMKIQPVADEIQQVENELDGNGRVLIRYSGTQPLLRVMVEGPDHEKVREYCERICDKIRESIPA